MARALEVREGEAGDRVRKSVVGEGGNKRRRKEKGLARDRGRERLEMGREGRE